MSRRGTAARQAARKRGLRAETLAALWLALKGYRILARGHRNAGGELDIVARKGRLLVFVEVKRRAGLDAAATAIVPRQRRRIEAAAALFAAHSPVDWARGWRFDAVLIGGGRIRHIRDAWRPETAS
jgi:putative endonuclease